MDIIFQFLLFLNAVLLLITYLLYPIFLIIKSTGKDSGQFKDSNDNCNISILISAYNEEKIIEKTVRNILKCDYDRNKIELIDRFR